VCAQQRTSPLRKPTAEDWRSTMPTDPGRPHASSITRFANCPGSHPPTCVGWRSSAIKMADRPGSLALAQNRDDDTRKKSHGAVRPKRTRAFQNSPECAPVRATFGQTLSCPATVRVVCRRTLFDIGPKSNQRSRSCAKAATLGGQCLHLRISDERYPTSP
jgi:hypothetical protein